MIKKKEKKKTVEKDGNESDVSEVYGPTDLNPDLKIPNMAPYLPIGPIETPSFIKFVNDMTADDQSVQSTVISSTKRNAENAANATAGVPVFEGGGNNASLGGIPKFLRSTSTNSKRSVDTAHLQGILLNLFPNQVQLPVEKKPSLHHTSETFDEPAIDKALKTMIRKQGSRQPMQHSLEQEKKLLEEKAPNLGQMMMMKNNNNAKTGVAKILFNLFPSSNPESVSHNTIVAARTVPPLERIEQTTTKNSVVKVLNKHQQVEWIPKQDQLLNRTASEIKMCQRSQINPGEVTYTNMSQRKQSSRKKYTDNKVWLRQCPSKLYLQDQDGDTVLHILIAKGHQEKAIKVIQNFSSSLDILNALGQTPLHLALYTEAYEVVRALLEHGAFIGVVDADGNSSVHIACQQKSLKMLELLFLYSPFSTEEFQRILSIRNNQGRAAIHLSLNHKDLQTLQYLIARGADVNIQEGRTGNTPLLIALINKDCDFADELLNQNADVNIPNYSNFYPLHFAVQHNHFNLVKILLEKGAEMGSRANEYDSASDTQIKLMLTKEMRRRRRQRNKQNKQES